MPPKITILGDASSATKAFEEATAGAQKLNKATDQVSAGFGRSKIAGVRLRSTLGGLAPVAGGLVIAGQAARELGSMLEVTGAAATTTTGILRNSGAELLSGNFVGAIKNLATEPLAASAALDKLAQSSLKVGNQVEIDRLKAASAALGWEGFAKQMDEVSAAVSNATSEMARLGVEADIAATAVRTGLSSAAADAAQFGEQSSRFGRGPGAIAEGQTRKGSAKPPKTATVKGLTANDRRLRANRWFDAGVAREIDKARDLADRAQIQALQATKAEIADRLAATKDPTRRLNLQDEIRGIDREITSLNKDIADSLKQKAEDLKRAHEKLAEAFKRQADQIKSAVLDALDFKKTKIDTARALEDARKSLALARRIGGPEGIRLAMRDMVDAQMAVQRQAVEATAFRVSEGPKGPVNALQVGTQVFYINSNRSPEEIAKQVAAIFSKQGKIGGQARGRNPGATHPAGV